MDLRVYFLKFLFQGGKITIFSASNLCLRILATVIKNESEKERGKDEKGLIYIYTHIPKVLIYSFFAFRFCMPSSSLAASAFQTPQSMLKIINKRIMKRSHSHVSLVMSRFSIIHIISWTALPGPSFTSLAVDASGPGKVKHKWGPLE